MSGGEQVSVLEREKRVLAPSLAHFTPLVVDRGEGCYLYTKDGHRYLDFVSGIATNNVGHCHPRVVAAATNQLCRLIHASANAVHYEANVLLAEKIAQLSPGDLNMCFFSNSGAEAIEGAIKLARYVTGRPIVISFLGGFHGRTYGALSVTSSKAKYRSHYEPFLPGVYMSPYAYCYRCPMGQHISSCSLECLSYLRWMLETAIPAGEVAAILVEPILGEGGYVVPPVAFLQGLRNLCDENGILLIFDEIQTGFGRTGRFFASEHSGVIPDIMTLAKAIASGFPLSAVVSTSGLMSQWSPGAHGGTFGGNPVSCAAALASIAVIEEEGLVQNAARIGEWTLMCLNEMKRLYPCIGDVRGEGLMIGLEIVDGEGSPNGELAKQVCSRCLEQGLLLITCGFEDHVIRLMPPLIITDELMNAALNILDGVLRSLGNW